MNSKLVIAFTFLLLSEVLTSCIIPFDWASHRAAVLRRIELRSKIFQMTNDENVLAKYDFVVAGAGSAGSTLIANLLKKTQSTKILLIEAGSHVTDEIICNFQNVTQTYDTSYVKNYVSEPQVNLGDRKIKLVTGRGLGGSSLVNTLKWIRGDKNDYNDWADMVGDQSWSYKNLLPLFKQIETYPNGGPSRGTTGPIVATTIQTNNSAGEIYLDAVSSIGYEINKDYNSGEMQGVSYLQLNVAPSDVENQNKGVRQDAFSTQLRDFIGTNRLDILIESQTIKVELDDSKAVRYLEFQSDDQIYRVKAEYEVILSTGALKTPLVLMRSGIGNCDDLEALDIECKVNLPMVGQNLQDHVGLFMFQKIKTDQIPADNVLVQLFEGSVTPKRHKKTKPKFQIFTFYTAENSLLGELYLGFNLILLHPASTGSVKLQSMDINDDPIIDLNYLSIQQDEEDLLEGFKKSVEFGDALLNTNCVDGFFIPSKPNCTDDEGLEYIKENLESFNNYCGTCKMGRRGDKTAVVDSKLKVVGVKGLRIADASIIPSITSANSNLPSIIIGAKCAQILMETYFRAENNKPNYSCRN